MIGVGILQAVHGLLCKFWSDFPRLAHGASVSGGRVHGRGQPRCDGGRPDAPDRRVPASSSRDLFRIVDALSVYFQNRIWLPLHGLINVFLGFCDLAAWPLSGLWVIGLFGITDMIFNGWSLVMLGLAAKNSQPSHGDAVAEDHPDPERRGARPGCRDRARYADTLRVDATTLGIRGGWTFHEQEPKQDTHSGGLFDLAARACGCGCRRQARPSVGPDDAVLKDGRAFGASA